MIKISLESSVPKGEIEFQLDDETFGVYIIAKQTQRRKKEVEVRLGINRDEFYNFIRTAILIDDYTAARASSAQQKGEAE